MAPLCRPWRHQPGWLWREFKRDSGHLVPYPITHGWEDNLPLGAACRCFEAPVSFLQFLLSCRALFFVDWVLRTAPGPFRGTLVSDSKILKTFSVCLPVCFFLSFFVFFVFFFFSQCHVRRRSNARRHPSTRWCTQRQTHFPSR